MPRVKEIEEGDPSTNVGGSGEVPPPSGGGNSTKPSTPTRSKDSQLASELKVLNHEQKIAKLKKKIKHKNLKGQEVSSSSSNEEVNDSSSDDDESFKAKKGKDKKKHGSMPSYNTISFNYDSLPSNHTFTIVHSGKVLHFDGMNYSKWHHGMKVHQMLLNLNVWKVVCTGVDFPEEGETPDYIKLQYIHNNAQASNVLLSSLQKDEYDHVDGLEKASEISETLRLFHEGSRLVHKAKVEMLEGQLDQFVMLDDETPQEMYNHMKLMVNKVRAYGSKRWTNNLMVQRVLRTYTTRDTTLVMIIRSDPNHMRMKPEDILARIINHELLLEEARYVKNLSKGIVSTKKDVALKASKKSKKKQIQVESSSEEEQDKDEEDEEKECDEEEMARSSRNSTNT
jgi:hypothetical protein